MRLGPRGSFLKGQIHLCRYLESILSLKVSGSMKPQSTRSQSSPPQVPEPESTPDDLFSKIVVVESATLRTQTLESGQDSHQKVMIQREFAQLRPIASDKHRIMQMLLNLLRNASQAMETIPKAERVIQVRILAHGSERVRIEVQDCGVGLTEEQLTRIFAHGFTTKAQGGTVLV